VDFINLSTAISVTGLSKRTLWRRIADGVLRTEDASNMAPPPLSQSSNPQTRVAVDDVFALSRLRLELEDRELIVAADAGSAEAQCDLALLFLAQDLAAEAAGWLERSARQGYLEGMHWLGRCHIAGNGVDADERRGIDWIARAANHGHATAAHMVRYLYNPARQALGRAELEVALDAIERKVLSRVIADIAGPA